MEKVESLLERVGGDAELAVVGYMQEAAARTTWRSLSGPPSFMWKPWEPATTEAMAAWSSS